MGWYLCVVVTLCGGNFVRWYLCVGGIFVWWYLCVVVIQAWAGCTISLAKPTVLDSLTRQSMTDHHNPVRSPSSSSTAIYVDPASEVRSTDIYSPYPPVQTISNSQPQQQWQKDNAK
jgi:hypothetical protein